MGLAVQRSNFFQIKSITCELDTYPCPLAYEPVLVSLYQKNILKITPTDLLSNLQAFDSGLAEVKLRRVLPDKIHLKLIRRQTLARIEAPDGLVVFLDNQGEIFPSLTTEASRKLPVIKLPDDKPVLMGPSELGTSLRQLIKALDEYFIASQQINWLSPQIVEIQTVKGPLVVLNSQKDISSAIASLQYILSGYKIDEVLPVKIDLRFDKPILSY